MHVADILADPDYASPENVAAGLRTCLGVPLLREGAVLGTINLARNRVEPFTERQIELVRTFADQAVIAIENARLLTELRESLEQQTATAEVLQVINFSPGDLAPVFDAMVERAVRLCAADEAAVRTYDGKFLHPAAAHGKPDVLEKLRELGPSALSRPGGMYDFLARGKNVSCFADVRETAAYRENPIARARIDARNVRSWLAVALRKDDALLGVINVHRHEVRPFSDKEIALLENFAAQAVIAMENARLLGELQARTRDLEESLECTTATSDVLNVISRSTADVQPVLDTVVETAVRLCGADSATISIREGEVYRFVSASALDAEYWAALRQRTVVPGRESIAGRTVLEGRVVHIEDVAADPDYALPETVAAGLRTWLGVPLLREGAVLGTINLGRKRVQPYTERQIELVRTFADQAVIAMENARLLGELQARTRDLEESLEYQTATSEVLNVISRSTADVQPVLDTVAETAARLCGADRATIFTREGEVYRAVSTTSADPEHWAIIRQRRTLPGRETVSGRVLLEGRVVQIADIRADPDFAVPEALAGGNRTMLGVPLLREGA
ncbi:MAG: GAF domain-containing protein, partial [Alphaproteobacteria bacterium]|nr:GAF domain-containing protein [Alphaproteobacteria bacterium]